MHGHKKRSHAQSELRTYPQPDSHSRIVPYNQHDHAWTSNQFDMSNEIDWIDESDHEDYFQGVI